MAASGGHWVKASDGAAFVATPDPAAELTRVQGQIERVSQAAKARREASMDPSIRGYRPADADWLSEDERNQLDRLQGRAAILGRQVFGSSQERVALKRVLRAAGVPFDSDAPMAVLQRLVAGLGRGG